MLEDWSFLRHSFFRKREKTAERAAHQRAVAGDAIIGLNERDQLLFDKGEKLWRAAGLAQRRRIVRRQVARAQRIILGIFASPGYSNNNDAGQETIVKLLAENGGDQREIPLRIE